ncbi:hypothetical protein CIB48_g4577 [Xylaria polymorpha]|nr:hypothetical protein CIB48_g4577 [Xylaria polymorpha]
MAYRKHYSTAGARGVFTLGGGAASAAAPLPQGLKMHNTSSRFPRMGQSNQRGWFGVLRASRHSTMSSSTMGSSTMGSSGRRGAF